MTAPEGTEGESEQLPAGSGNVRPLLECNQCGSFPERAGLYRGDEQPGDMCPAGHLDDYDCDGTLVAKPEQLPAGSENVRETPSKAECDAVELSLKRADKLCRTNADGDRVLYMPSGKRDAVEGEHLKTADALGYLAAEVRRLREENAALRTEISAHRVAGVELAEENARLNDQLTIRDMQLSTHRELMAQAEAKSDELRGRWDRAETAREELQKLVEQTRAIATQRVEAAHAGPRYSTEAVDALLEASTRLILWLQLKYKEPLKLVQYRDLCAASETVRASREPK